MWIYPRDRKKKKANYKPLDMSKCVAPEAERLSEIEPKNGRKPARPTRLEAACLNEIIVIERCGNSPSEPQLDEEAAGLADGHSQTMLPSGRSCHRLSIICCEKVARLLLKTRELVERKQKAWWFAFNKKQNALLINLVTYVFCIL